MDEINALVFTGKLRDIAFTKISKHILEQSIKGKVGSHSASLQQFITVLDNNGIPLSDKQVLEMMKLLDGNQICYLRDHVNGYNAT